MIIPSAIVDIGDLFDKYQHLLLWFVNTKVGREFLSIPQELPSIVKFDEGSYHIIKKKTKKKTTLTGTFYAGSPYQEKLGLALTTLSIVDNYLTDFQKSTQALLHYLNLQRGIFPLVLHDSFDGRSTSSTTIWDGGSDSAGGVMTVGENVGGAQVYRGLVKFDLSSIQSGSTVSVATLTFTISDSPGTSSRTMNVYRILRNWTASASWTTYNGTDNWTTAGFSSEGNDRTASIGSWTTNTAWVDGNTTSTKLTTSEVEAMIVTNYGIGCYNTTESNDNINYKSANDATSTNRPRLEITYTLPVTSGQERINATFAGRITQFDVNANSSLFLVGEPDTAAYGTDRGYVKLPFTNVPANATITGVTLQCYLSGDDASNDRTIRVYRILQGITSGATWNKYDGTNNWATAGCSNTTTDREATDIGSRAFTNGEAAGYKDFILTASEVQEMFDGTITNNGLLLQCETETNDRYTFQSVGDSNPPRWVITYTLPGGFLGILL